MPALPHAENLRRALEAERTEIHTAKPGQVVSYNAAVQTATVDLGVREVLPSGDDDTADTVQDFPRLVDVPVMFPGCGDVAITWTIEAGDTGMVVFLDTDPGAWRAGDGGPVDPGLGARHGLAGAVFVPGLRVRSDTLKDAPGAGVRRLRLGLDSDTRIEIRSGTVEAGGTKALAESADVKAHLAKISADLATVFGVAGAGTPTYVYATEIVASPIDTSILKGD